MYMKGKEGNSKNVNSSGVWICELMVISIFIYQLLWKPLIFYSNHNHGETICWKNHLWSAELQTQRYESLLLKFVGTGKFEGEGLSGISWKRITQATTNPVLLHMQLTLVLSISKVNSTGSLVVWGLRIHLGNAGDTGSISVLERFHIPGGNQVRATTAEITL